MQYEKRVAAEGRNVSALTGDITGAVSPSNNRLFSAEILGPKGTPYEGGHFRVLVFLPEKFPLVPPKLKFMTRIFHPNIDFLGRICLDKLKPIPGGWGPGISIPALLLSLQSLLSAPNHGDPLNIQVAHFFVENGASAFAAKAREYTQLHARPSA